MSKPIHHFTTEPLGWLPYIRPVRLADATAEQLDSIKDVPKQAQSSNYILTLAHDPETLAVRIPLFNTIMAGKLGLGLAEREMGAIGASVVNHCVYCVSAHAAKFLKMTKREDIIADVLAHEEKAELDDYWFPIFDFSAKLSRTTEAITPGDINALRDIGLGTGEIADLILAGAIFSWANRLMHTLGEAITV